MNSALSTMKKKEKNKKLKQQQKKNTMHTPQDLYNPASHLEAFTWEFETSETNETSSSNLHMKYSCHGLLGLLPVLNYKKKINSNSKK